MNSSAAVESGVLEPSRIQLLSLLRLRWGWILVQVGATLVAVRLLGQDVEVGPVVAVVLGTVISNLLAAAWQKRQNAPTEWLGTLLVAMDIVLFSVVLHFTGGPENPFGFLYLVPIALGAYTLAGLRIWLLVALTLLCSAALFWLQPDAPHSEHAHHMAHGGHGGAYSLHLQGMWIGLGVAAVFIVGFVGRLSAALRQRDAQLAKMRSSSERNARMASLTTLAAGAAHELATPLGTIAVVSKELGRRLKAEDSKLEEEALLIRQEVGRCREILDRLSASVRGEAATHQSLSDVLGSILEDFPGRERLEIEQDPSAESDAPLALPRAAVVTAVRALLQNALDASSSESRVQLTARRRDEALEITVADEGCGMDAATLEHAAEPFFTTKPEGRGLGLFLASSVAEQLGGSMRVSSARGSGTTVRWRIPANLAHVS